MKIEGPLLPGTFIDRPNRFLTRIKLDGTIVESHLPDPGRLRELLVPGVRVLLRKAPSRVQRKTRYSTVMVTCGDILVSLVSALPNRFVKEELMSGNPGFLKDFTYVRSEVTRYNHRFDFLLEDRRRKGFYLEVKSVTYAENGVGKFPDAVTSRGTSHVRTLARITREGERAGILFVCQRPDVERFEPMVERDPVFADALLKAATNGVKIWCISTFITETDMTFYREIPVYLHPL